MNEKITIIGGSGFIGTNLCRHLANRNQDFEIVDLKMSREFPEACKIGDVRDIKSLRDAVTGQIIWHRREWPGISGISRANA